MNALTILSIDTSGKTASAAIMKDGRLLGETAVVTRLTHSQVILPMVERLLDDCEMTIDDIDIAAAANGPGSYTGLRIGIGAVKGMCAGSKKLECAGVSTLLALAYNLTAFEGRAVTVMKARGSICYFAMFDIKDSFVARAHKDCLAESDEIVSLISGYSGRVMLIGDCAQDIKALLQDKSNITTAPENATMPRASGICMAVLRDSSLIVSPQQLTVSYLQPTKAQKDRAHSKEKQQTDV